MMFSRTVRPGKIRRPSGTCEMPCRTIASGFMPRSDCPPSTMSSHDRSGTSPEIDRNVVLFPRTVGAEQGDDLALAHLPGSTP